MKWQHYGVLGRLERPCPPVFAGFRMDVVHQSAEQTGGDFYYVASPRFGSMTVVIGDACGKGARAAEWVEQIGWHTRQLCRARLAPHELLSRLNVVTCQALPDHGFITATCLELDAVAKRAVVSNAGHVPPIVSTEDGAAVVGRASGPPLGIAANAAYEASVFELTHDDVVILMTDGVLEPVERDLQNMTTALSLVNENSRASLARIGRAFFERASSSYPRSDDCTVMSIGVDAMHFRPFTAYDEAS